MPTERELIEIIERFVRLEEPAPPKGIRPESLIRAERGSMTTVGDKPNTEAILADLLPDGCTRLTWRDRHADVCYAERNSDGQWSASTDYGVTYSLDDLDALVNHATVVPLRVSDQYVEERR